MSKKYLIIGDANSMHIYNFVKTVVLPLDYEIHLMTLSCERVKESYREFYKINNITLHSIAEKLGKTVPNATRKQRLFNLIKKWKLARSLPNFDICHIHSVYKTSMLLYLMNRKKFRYLIASYWGGDIEEKRSFVVKMRKKCFRYAKAITVTTKKTYEDFQEIYGTIFNNKLQICRFATAGIECIRSIYTKKDAFECKKDLDIPTQKICITCGYSAYAEQHQDTILSKIALLPNEIKKSIFVIVPMQYGRYNKEYIDKVHNEAEKCGCEYRILEEYYSFEKNAEVTVATDIYIHMRDTDAFSNSLKEQVYSGSQCLVGSWLKYYELEEINVDIMRVDNFDSLPDKLLESILSKKNKKELVVPIYELYSSEAIKAQWGNIIAKCEDV